jgi:PAS domain S-box-containing protein
MTKNSKTKARREKLLLYVSAIVLGWTVVMTALFAQDHLTLNAAAKNLALREARAHFQRDVAFRKWATTHGGFYVPTDERTPPNPYLAHINERDIETPTGVDLTLMNPAYALRQMNEEYSEVYGIAGHITSLRPLRPENSADPWETAALEAFENGETEVLEYTDFNGEYSLRLMQPLITQEGCLKCHAHQGYQVGDIRGGVSISVPLAPFLAEQQQTLRSHALSFLLLWGLGAFAIIQGGSLVTNNILKREQAQEELKDSYDQLEDRVQERIADLSRMNDQLSTEIAARLKLEEALYRSGELLNATGKMALVGGWEIDIPSNKLTWTEETYHIHELSPDSDINVESGISFFREEDQPILEKALQQAILEGKPYDLELGFITAKGNPLWVRTIAEPRTENGKVTKITGTIQDITKRKESEKQLQEYSSRLEEMVAERTQALQDAQEELLRKERLAVLGQMAGSVAHELRNPLGVISNSVYYLNMLLPECGECSQKADDSLVMITDAVRRSNKIITDLLDFSRGQVSEPAPANLLDLLDAIFAAHPAPEGVLIEIVAAPDLPPVFVDIQQIEQVFTNLIMNAYQAMPDGGKLSLQAAPQNGDIAVAITDSGCGIPAENMSKLFEPLFTTKTRGIGLGLAVTKKLVELNGGQISVESQVGQGTTFKVLLPAALIGV